LSAIEAQKVLRKRMVDISHTAVEAGILNYGSLVVQPVEVKATKRHPALAA
jgi:hypothetical protein